MPEGALGEINNPVSYLIMVYGKFLNVGKYLNIQRRCDVDHNVFPNNCAVNMIMTTEHLNWGSVLIKYIKEALIILQSVLPVHMRYAC